MNITFSCSSVWITVSVTRLYFTKQPVKVLRVSQRLLCVFTPPLGSKTQGVYCLKASQYSVLLTSRQCLNRTKQQPEIFSLVLQQLAFDIVYFGAWLVEMGFGRIFGRDCVQKIGAVFKVVTAWGNYMFFNAVIYRLSLYYSVSNLQL